jgi:hypothetical protein
MAILR